MTDQQILQQAIQKAIDERYKPDGIKNVTNFKVTVRGGQAWVRWFNDDGVEVCQDVEHVIFNHDFAKALWGEDESLVEFATFEEHDDWKPRYGSLAEALVAQMFILKSWQVHLQQMVIANNPIKYLGENI